MRSLIAWLLFFVLIAWSALVGALAGAGAVTVRRRLPDSIAIGIAVLLVFGLALAFGGRALRPAYVVAGAIGFAAAVLAALRPESEAGGAPASGAGVMRPPERDRPRGGGFWR